MECLPVENEREGGKKEGIETRDSNKEGGGGRMERGSVSPTSTDKIPALPIAEVVEDLVSVGLGHAGVDEETGVAQLRDLLGQQLHTLDRVAEYDTLVDLQLCV